MEKPFQIYRSSAGSGKTRTLAKEYIVLAMRHPAYFKYILAVTFTNKATQEMKDRIVEYLGQFTRGESPDLAAEIRARLNMSEKDFHERSHEVLSGILHQYSQFSISTIDAFFQRVIRSFTRESGLLGNFRLEAEVEPVMQEVIAELMEELGEKGKEQLTQWVLQLASEKLSEGENWNITQALTKFSKEIFEEKFKLIEQEIRQAKDALDLQKVLSTIRKQMSIFLDTLRSKADQILSIIQQHGLTGDDFKGKTKLSPMRYLFLLSRREYLEPTKPTLKCSLDENEWVTKENPKRQRILTIARQELMPLLLDIIEYDKKNALRYQSLELVERNFYNYGLITDITRKLRDYKAEHNIMLLSDAPQFLRGIINESDTPFIYEKVGSFYRHYLIDEFQDTSLLQWKNFQPLLREALDQNNMSFVVGDVKQSIYRWRGGDLGLLQQTVEDEMGAYRTEKHVLNYNYRSAINLVEFNNALFKRSAVRVSEATGQSLPEEVFGDVSQLPLSRPSQGFVRVGFLEGGKGEDGFEDQALRRIPKWLEELQSRGIALRDIAILVRRNEEGQRIATHLLHYKNSAEARPEFRYDVVSNESLKLDAAASVLLLVAALKYLANPDDKVARGELVHEYQQLTGRISPGQADHNFIMAGRKRGQGVLPEELLGRGHSWVNLSLFDLVESLIRLFKLGEQDIELAYLQSFQDLVLEFSMQEKNDLASFLEWWEDIRTKRSIQVAANTDAVSIYTLHKSKGLQFKYVLIPFCNWRMNHDGLHSPLLWCKTSEPPLDQLKYVAVKYKSTMEQSWFAEDYREEFTKTFLDNLNLLYVAMTRAEEGLIVLAPRPGNKKDKSKLAHVGELVFEAIQSGAGLKGAFDEANGLYSVGDIERLPQLEVARKYLPIALDRYRSTDWRKKLVIKREGREFFQPAKTEKRQRINYGILMHTVLSRIVYAADARDVLNELHLEGILMEEEISQLSATIHKMMNDPVMGSWFDKSWMVRTESPVIIPGGTLSRLDRVIWKEVQTRNGIRRKAVIIDYKTGEKKKDDRIQVEKYAGVLSAMGYVDVEGYLLYLENLEVIAVMNRANLTFDF